MKKIELTDKELAQVWSIVAWFQDNQPVSSALVRRLFPGDDNPDNYKFDKEIEDRIIHVGKFLERLRAENSQ